MKGYRPATSRNQCIPPIAADHIAAVLADFSARRACPLLRACFTSAVCPPMTSRERDTALAMRRASVKALVDFDADQLHATSFVWREEFRAREALTKVEVSCRADILTAEVMEAAHG